MEVIAIQKSALDGMQNELRELLELTENATKKYTPIFAEEQWLDNQEVCLMMNITKRTLQTYKNPYRKYIEKLPSCNERRNIPIGRGYVQTVTH